MPRMPAQGQNSLDDETATKPPRRRLWQNFEGGADLIRQSRPLRSSSHRPQVQPQQEMQFAVGLLLHFDFGSRDIDFTDGMVWHRFMPARLGIVGTDRAPAVARVQQFLDGSNQNAAVTAFGLPGTQAARLGPQLGSSQGNAQCFSCLSGSTGLAGQL